MSALRHLLWPVFFGTVLLAWAALWLAAQAGRGVVPEGVPRDMWAALCVPAAAAPPVVVWAMWGLMAAAMMLPGFAPALATFRRLPGQTFGASAALVGGYLAVWLAASGAGAAAQIMLSRAGFIAADGASLSRTLSATLLIAAGLYQFSTLKAACLARCRHPLTFFMGRWRSGPGPALRMGAELGLLCLGCCWLLMALGFVGGTMNIAWMGAATAFMAAEKLPQLGRPLTAPAGVALVAAGLSVATGII